MGEKETKAGYICATCQRAIVKTSQTMKNDGHAISQTATTGIVCDMCGERLARHVSEYNNELSYTCNNCESEIKEHVKRMLADPEKIWI